MIHSKDINFHAKGTKLFFFNGSSFLIRIGATHVCSEGYLCSFTGSFYDCDDATDHDPLV
jgi:hypothetical protein